ncbi:MAG: glycosyltransferase [Planctomycetes bacterium]|nr:glycosyltransferase [Planctomycetota bacterium]
METANIVLATYWIVLALLCLHGLHRVWMIVRFRWRGGARTDAPREWPVVTVQLPIYDERAVAERVIRCAGELEYPREKLEIQVLDDSTDETRAIVDRAVAELVARGLEARVVRREGRRGYKAGALDHGLSTARGELVCIFDADFMPDPSFLRALVGHFAEPRVGMVQARWEHENREASTLTRAQSTLLDGHFVIEHKVRHDAGLFFNFNGTAGIWRKRAIVESGGWHHDTLTEDLDLSYRAQLAGWRFVYAPHVSAPAEVPPNIAAFKSQQRRWAKGSVQVAKKLLGTIVTSDQPLRVKLEALAHLTGNSGYPLVLLLAALLPWIVGIERGAPLAWQAAVFAASTCSVFLFYETGQRALGRSLARRVLDVVAAVALGIGMSVSQSRAVLSGLFRGTGEFVRTPKYGTSAAARTYRAAWRGLPGIELAFAAWFGWGIARALEFERWATLPFLALFFAGFAWVGALSLSYWMRQRRA